MKELTDFLDKYGVEYTIDGEPVFVPGDLEIEDQELTRLPESFVGLPESFGNLKIGGSVYLRCPKLTHLPESFGNLKVSGGVCFIDGIVREIISRKVGR